MYSPKSLFRAMKYKLLGLWLVMGQLLPYALGMKNKHKGIIIILVVLVLAIIFSWANRATKNVNTRVGVIAPLTGIVAFYGEDIKRGVLAGVEASSTLIFEDDKCEPAAAISAFNKLVDVDRVPLIIGPGCGSPQEAIVPVLKNKDAVVIVPSAASEKLFDQSGGKFFNLQYSLEKEATFLADKMFDRNLRRVVIITYQNAFSKTVADSFKASFQGEVAKEIVFIDGTSDISTELAKLEGLKFDAIISTDITFFFVQGLQKLKQYGISVPVYSEYVAELPAARPMVEGVIYSYPAGLEGEGGAVFELSKQAARISDDATQKCHDDTGCIRKYLTDSGLFDSKGLSKRDIILKQIVGGVPKEI